MTSSRNIARQATFVLALVALLVHSAAAFTTFEAGQVRPLALSPDGSRLFAVNTPDARLEVFAVNADGISLIGTVPVGLEPVAVAARTNSEVWVVNHLSDSISVVDVGSTPPRVVRTLLVGDEPRDIVFAGPTDANGNFVRAFITTARRGQNLPASVPAMLTTQGVPRALVWVFNASNPGPTAGGSPESVVELFGDTPRALAATPDGAFVYAAIFHSGNQTTSISEGAVCDGGAAVSSCGVDGIEVPGGLPNAEVPGGLPAPNKNVEQVPGPETGLIVKLNPSSGKWEDQLGRNWTNAVRFNLPDKDVFKIDALADTPKKVDSFAHVGTVLFNMAVNPSNGKLYVTNTDARNEVRFEGPGKSATTVRGHLHETRITVVDGASVLPRHLNKHIDLLPQGYRTTPMPADVKEKSLAIPTGMAVAGDGTLYVAAFGSSKVGTFQTAQLETDTFTPSSADHIEVSGGGPSGLALDEGHHRLYVLTRFDNAVKVVDTNTRTEIAQHPLHNPEPVTVVQGRRFLYDARLTSSNGEASCASCHVFGDFDSLGWDLGNPDNPVAPNPNPIGPSGGQEPFHPMKGPMTTQTLRGMAHHGPMHWRGDRTGGTFVGDPQALDEELAFEAFNVAFDGLLGRDDGMIPAADMKAFADFVLEITLPPNPVRSLDNQLDLSQSNGRSVFFNQQAVDLIATCNGCHTLDPSQGFFGTAGKTTFENETQQFKVSHLRNAYQKVGMFGTPSVSFVKVPLDNRQYQADQVRGFGYSHDGSVDRVIDFLHATVFNLSDDARRDLEQFILAFDTNLAPIVGQQVTLTSSNGAAVASRITLMIARARTTFTLIGQPDARECDLVVKGTVGGVARGFLLDTASGTFRADRRTDSLISDASLRALADIPGQELTYTCVPPGSGVRMALDRDEDGYFDRDELDAGTDPADPLSHPAVSTPSPTPTPTNTVLSTATVTQSPVASSTPTATTVPIDCVGDCDNSARVTVDELVRGVNIALGDASLDDCASFDADNSHSVTVDELVRAVNAALDGCAAD